MLLFVVLLIALMYIICKCKSYEGFAHVQPPVPREYITEENAISIPPPNFDNETNAIYSSTDYIPYKINPAWTHGMSLADNEDDDMSVMFNLCSPSCCNQQYPIPHKLDSDPLIAGKEASFVATPMSCSNSYQGSGCMCVSKNEANFLRNRGGNSV